MRFRLILPSFVVALLALLIAASGMSFAAGRDGHANPDSSGSANAALTCPSGARRTFGLCLNLKAGGPVTLSKARHTCDSNNGRLPSLGELDYIAHLPGLTWANGQLNQYEFTSTNTDQGADTPVARDHAGNLFDDASQQTFWYHCLRMPTAP